ncbi:MAG: nitroreductase family protein [bacterium]
MGSIYDIIISRRSQRRYTRQVPPRSLVEKIVDGARWAPSAGNRQNFHWWISGGEKRNELVKIISAVSERAPELFADYDKRIQAFLTLYLRTLGGAPIIIVLSYEKRKKAGAKAPFDWEKWDYASACAAMQNLLLLAHAEGLGTCWMTAPLLVHEEIKKCLDIPKNHELVGVTPLGYPAHEIPLIPRIDPELKKTVKWFGF